MRGGTLPGDEMAAAERIDRGYLGRILQMTLLAPDIVELTLDARQPAKLGLPRVLDRSRPSGRSNGKLCWTRCRRLTACMASHRSVAATI